MSSTIVDFLVGKKVAVGTKTDGYVYFDAVESVTYKKSKTLTESPVEDGSTVTDHSIKKPEQVTFFGIVSNTRIDVPIPIPGVTYAEDADYLMRRFLDEDIVVEVLNLRHEYPTMQVIDVDVQDNASTARGFFATITLQEWVVANSETIALAADTTSQKTNKPIKKATPKAPAAPKASMLSGIGRWFGI